MTLAFHFLRADATGPRLRDGRPAELGEWVEHEGPVEICARGLHASYRLIDALNYYEWDGGVACLVEVDGVELEQEDKCVCRRRRIVAWAPCDDVLRIFAREQALSVIHLWAAPAIVKEYLETGDETKRSAAGSAAGSAALSAAREAALSAAREAARSAAWSAALSAAREAARSAAWSAALSAAWEAARSAAREAARSAAREAARSAAREAARSAAREAARSAANDLLESMMLAEMEWAP